METPIRVLVVEDDLEAAAAIARRLEGDGATVTTAIDPAGLMPQLESSASPWDVVLLDVDLKVGSGIAVLERIHAAGSLASVVMLTTDHTARTATACMRAGAFYYLTKPVRPMDVSAIACSAARYARLRAQLARGEIDASPRPESIVPRPKDMFFADTDEVVSLAAGKRAAAATFERDYLVRVMWIAKGSIAEAARLADIDRTNFRRLLQRHQIDPTGFR